MHSQTQEIGQSEISLTGKGDCGHCIVKRLPTNGVYRNNSISSKPVVLNIDDFGAKGDGFTDDTKILQDVWKVACSLPSRAKILIPKEKFYLIKPSNFGGPCQSDVTLKMSGSIIAPREPEAWHGLDVHKWLYFHGLKNFKLEGDGIFDGKGQEWWARSCKRNDSNPCTHAPTAITFHKCTNLKVRNVTMFNSQQMHMAFTNCKHVSAANVTVMAPRDSPNTDGIHISASTYVELKNLIIITGDDCISIVSNSSRIRINNVVCGQGHGISSIGSLGKYNTYAAVQDVIVNRAYFFDTENGVRIKTWQGGSGFARKITFQNIWMQNVSNPIIIDQYYCDSSETCLNQTSAVSIENISFRGIKGTSAKEEAMIFKCSDSYPCKRIHLEDIQLTTPSGIANSYCWEAYGTIAGLIYPPPCISSGDIVIRHNVKPNSTYWRKDYYAFF
ncbi:hypothetical protein RD792_015232 [Penstemon davidsonii]|uniref:Polygalacturonase n=1 Tax=Penstemon davidsonii TaxID=160366 RepID=A0ABR0CRG4_9LAMI|nr:hypothetical protein RD792_015232 [Penstemon davidsonii]